MPNVIIRSTNEASSIVTEAWAKMGLGYLRENLSLAMLASRDAQDEMKEEGDVINIHKRGGLVVQSPAEDEDLAPQAPTNTNVKLTLDQYDAVPWKVSDITRSTAIADGIDYVKDAASVLAESIERKLAGEYANAGLADVGTYGVDTDLATIRRARLIMNQGNVPRSGRALFLSSKDDDALIGLDKLTDVDRAGSTEALREATLGRLYGFDIYSSNLVPETGPVGYVDVVDNTDGNYTITIDGNDATIVAATDTLQAISDALVADINADGAINTIVTASNAGGTTTVITLVAVVEGTDFTLAVASPSSGLSIDSRGVHMETHNMAMHPAGLSLAMRPLALPPEGSGAAGSYIVDPESGLALRLTVEYSTTKRGVLVNMDCLYGVLMSDPRLALELRT